MTDYHAAFSTPLYIPSVGTMQNTSNQITPTHITFPKYTDRIAPTHKFRSLDNPPLSYALKFNGQYYLNNPSSFTRASVLPLSLS
jgi:hypothetical protein